MKYLFPLIILAITLSACFPAPGYKQYRSSAGTGNLPANPDPNKCYVRTVTPDEYEVRTVEFLTYSEEDAAKYPHEAVVMVLTPEYGGWETTAYEGCESPDPNDCQVLCYRTYDAETVDVYHPIDPTQGKPFYQQYDLKQIIAKGGLTAYEEIDCALMSYNNLLVEFAANAATLSAVDREVVAEKLLFLMRERSNIRIQINAHTDSRGSGNKNLNLSEQRAGAVADYLVEHGINRSRIVSKGYGETQLLNRCQDGVNCSEEEHQINDRVEFRVLNLDN